MKIRKQDGPPEDLLYFDETKQYDKLIEIFGEEANILHMDYLNYFEG